MQNNWYKEHPNDKIWWIDNCRQAVGDFLFSFDKKKIFNLSAITLSS
jgi:hypothetical protein